jgi:tetratricopeptide (TPR) repeat protein
MTWSKRLIRRSPAGVMLLLLAAVASVSADDAIQPILQQGIDAWVANDTETALSRMEQVVEQTDAVITANPTALAYVQRSEARSYLERFTTEEIFADIDAALAIDPNFAPAYYLRGRLKMSRLETDPYKEALADFEIAVDLDNSKWEHHNLLGFCRMQLGEYGNAVSAFNEAVRLNPDLGNPRQLRGESYYSLGMYERALEDYLGAQQREAAPSSRLYYTTGECYYQLGQYRKTIEQMQKAFAGDATDVDCHIHIGNCHYLLHEPKEALAAYDAATALNAEAGLQHHCRALALVDLGRMPEAIEASERAKSLGYDSVIGTFFPTPRDYRQLLSVTVLRNKLATDAGVMAREWLPVEGQPDGPRHLCSVSLNGNIMGQDLIDVTADGVFQASFQSDTFETPVPIIKFPIEEETTWTATTIVNTPDTGSQARIEFTFSTGNWQKITVPAGEYYAIPISESWTGTPLGDDQKYAAGNAQTRWVAAGVGDVRVQMRVQDSNVTMEFAGVEPIVPEEVPAEEAPIESVDDGKVIGSGSKGAPAQPNLLNGFELPPEAPVDPGAPRDDSDSSPGDTETDAATEPPPA